MFVTKAIATISSTDTDGDSPNGNFEAILSTPDLDRDQDVLAQDDWKTPLPARIHIDLDHEMSVAGTVGSAEPFFDSDGNMRIKGTYASTPRAQEVRTLVNEGHISTMSVAFMTDMGAKDGSPSRELLNGAFVAVPSNRGALVLSSKAFEAFEAERKSQKDDGVDTSEDDDQNSEKSLEGLQTGLPTATSKAGARNSAADSKMVQAIHDAASILGAQCASEPSPDVDDGSSEGANKAVKSLMVVGKSMTGSVEDLRDRIQCALNEACGYSDYSHGGAWPYVLATYMNPDGLGGSVVYSLGGETLCRAFADDGACVALDSNIQAVTLVTSIAAIPDTVDGDPTPLLPSAEAAKSLDAGGVVPELVLKNNTTDAPGAVLTSTDIEDFKAKLDALTKTSGPESGPADFTESPADLPEKPDSKAASQDPADDEPADSAGEAADDDESDGNADVEKQLLRARIHAANVRAMNLAS